MAKKRKKISTILMRWVREGVTPFASHQPRPMRTDAAAVRAMAKHARYALDDCGAAERTEFLSRRASSRFFPMSTYTGDRAARKALRKAYRKQVKRALRRATK